MTLVSIARRSSKTFNNNHWWNKRTFRMLGGFNKKNGSTTKASIAGTFSLFDLNITSQFTIPIGTFDWNLIVVAMIIRSLVLMDSGQSWIILLIKWSITEHERIAYE